MKRLILLLGLLLLVVAVPAAARPKSSLVAHVTVGDEFDVEVAVSESGLTPFQPVTFLMKAHVVAVYRCGPEHTKVMQDLGIQTVQFSPYPTGAADSNGIALAGSGYVAPDPALQCITLALRVNHIQVTDLTNDRSIAIHGEFISKGLM